MIQISKKHIIHKLKDSKGTMFHIIGIISVIWFAIRVLPAPHRSQYPCQQMAMPIAFGYIAFWSALFFGLITLIKKMKTNLGAIAPCILMVFILFSSIAGVGFADPSMTSSLTNETWDPIPKQPIGEPQGYNPGRVVWVWDPQSTEQYPDGYWWENQNNNQEVIDIMFSNGIKSLGDDQDEAVAWENIFKSFNQNYGNGDIGYQSGEKIAIKINMNNGFYNEYNWESDDVDASPYVVKGLLRKLVDVVGVAQEDISVYDASRNLFDWFYNRVYYEEYPADTLVAEFPDVHFVDLNGGPGREKIISSNEKVYFADGTCENRTLPTIVTEAKYMINMPIAKRHVGDRVTLSGKNWFGSWMEDVYPIHNYHTIGFSAMGNPAPQVDLLAHEHLGKKTLLLVGDGTYGSRYGLADCTHFEMYPFTGDWMSSLFFSQDAIALDSVLYDFFYVESTNGGPSEGAQNYLHQGAEPPINLYDPENDGEYITESLGVHEHWDTTIDIFSTNRYSGVNGNGIDFVPIVGENTSFSTIITKPKYEHLYFANNEIMYIQNLRNTIIIGKIDIEVESYGDEVSHVDFFIDDSLEFTDDTAPYSFNLEKLLFFTHEIKIIAYNMNGDTAQASLEIMKFF
jgi:hypothetical protein